ncbi:hypothetical protein HAX54_022260 [Datura stramonium]|uniref:Uncharacterized protein n=1 Tax=Datura stramonium TaxID=4076 RepID=A0ABS8UU50_DATST|nr:hypothetical protein [Datura stramonium]
MNFYSGVVSAAIQGGGAENYKLEVVGEHIDAVVLTNCLRKKLGQAQLESVGPVASANNNNNAWPQAAASVPQPPQPYSYLGVPQYQFYEATDPNPLCWPTM